MLLYHTTRRERLPFLLAEGLKPGQEGGMTEQGAWADEHYGQRPVYLSLEPGHRRTAYADAVVLAVDVDGVELLADLPSLVDHGAYLDAGPDGDVLWWEEGNEPSELAPYLDEGQVRIADLLSDRELSAAALALTGTAAVSEALGPERLHHLDLELAVEPADADGLDL